MDEAVDCLGKGVSKTNKDGEARDATDTTAVWEGDKNLTELAIG